MTLKDTIYCAVADDVRTLTFALADGAVLDNEERGYVLTDFEVQAWLICKVKL